MKHKLDIAWENRTKLYAEANKLHAEANKLHAEANKLHAEANKLYAEANKPRAEGDLVFLNAVIANMGNAMLEWTNTGCIVAGVMEFLNETK